MQYKKPKRLQRGDTVAIVSPSWGGPSVFPHVYENGLKVLQEWGLEIKEFPTARMDAIFLRENPKVRAKDINDAFADPKIKAIFTSIGGDDSVRILPFVNKDIIVKNPKILMGYSDTSTLHIFSNLQGLITFYGPSIMAGFSQMGSLPKKFKSHIWEMLFEPRKSYNYQSYGRYCDGYPDWANKENLGKVKSMKSDSGWRWLQGKTKVQGELFGGCIEVLEMMKATDFWPIKNFWDGKILFLETSEDKPSPVQVKYMLRNYGVQGIFEKVSAVLFGRARDYLAKEKDELDNIIKMMISNEFERPDLPIVTNMDFGHTDPQFILPLGVKAEIDCRNNKFRLLESWLD